MHGQHHSSEHTPHLAPALTAVTVCLVALAAFGLYARLLEARSITALAANEVIIQKASPLGPSKNQGTALQQAAWESGSLLPIYGSSELNLQTSYNRPFHPTSLFHDFPTGFTIFPIGRAEATCLIILQKLAAVGPILEGRKLAISLTPPSFFERLTARTDGYAGNFSPVHAGEFAFNTRLSLQLRQDGARRMLQFPGPLANRPLLKFALEQLADGSPLALGCYDAILPLGMLHNAILRFQDHWNVVTYLWSHSESISSPNAPREARQLDWPSLLRQAEAAYPAHCNNNEFGMDNGTWDRHLSLDFPKRRNAWSDEAFLGALQKNLEWADLELLLRELTELGARPLLLSSPIHGRWYDQCGVTQRARTAYYEKLREIGARYHVPVVDFADHEADLDFCTDNMGHLSPKGLVYYSQALDGFFHDAVPRQSDARGRKDEP
jgi:D-alanine transfer protein